MTNDDLDKMHSLPPPTREESLAFSEELRQSAVARQIEMTALIVRAIRDTREVNVSEEEAEAMALMIQSRLNMAGYVIR